MTSHPTGPQTSVFEHDALGRRTGETVKLAGLNRDIVTGSRYAPATGLVSARRLADGRVLRIDYTPATQGATVSDLRLQSAWVARIQDWLAEHVSPGTGETIGKLLPDEPIATGITVDIFNGLTASAAGNGIVTRRDFDIAGRLSGLHIDRVGEFGYRYGIGPRIAAIETAGQPVAAYHYRGFGRLDEPPESPGLVKVALATRLRRDDLGRVVEDGRFRYTYTAQGQVASVADQNGRLLARYRYNSLGQRVTKTVMRQDGEETIHTLWLDGNRVAEFDAAGHIVSQYLYLAEGQRIAPIAKLEGGHAFFIHTDHRGAPLAMTDAQRNIVWRASLSSWGTATPTNAGSFGPATLNLRLPGQYFDAETGLHDNWHRTYDPQSGRYLQPDPLGYPDGLDAYLYAGGDPVNRVDANGLYMTEIHYYMTYFLAVAAGIDLEDARIIALASQYVDDNPVTSSFNLRNWDHVDRLVKYHFTMTDPTDQWKLLPGFDNASLANGPSAPQIKCLEKAYQTARTDPAAQPNAALQLFGEYIHALEDTYGHRMRDDVPYSAKLFILDFLGFGHGFDVHQPDLTYDDKVFTSISWNTREARTFAMEQAVFQKMSEFKSPNGKVMSSADVEEAVRDFNAEEAFDGGKETDVKMKKKIAILNEYLAKWGYGDNLLAWISPKNRDADPGTGYNKGTEPVAAQNRADFLAGLDQKQYPGVLFNQ